MANNLEAFEKFSDIEGLIRQIVQEELLKLTHVSIDKQKTKSSQTVAKKKKRSEQPLIGLWKDREEMQDVENYLKSLRKPRY
jgi:hypothetical protein